jgi:hypothetical protein
LVSKILRVVAAYLRKHGMRLIKYLDDILIMSSSKEDAKADVKNAIGLLQHLGFLINVDKSIVEPSQIMEYLGLLINSNNLSFALPDTKASEVKTKCDTALVKGVISLREIASIMGNFIWAIPTMPFAQAHFRRMQAFYISKARRASFDLNTKCTLSLDTRRDLALWSSNPTLHREKVFFPKVPDLEIFSDASLTGWGACCNSGRTRGSWTLQDSEMHINELELIGALYAIQPFTAEAGNIAVRIYLDNITAVAYINHGGGTRSAELTRISAALTEWCEGWNIGIEAVYLQCRLNKVEDE